jgi:hypothetical protein
MQYSLCLIITDFSILIEAKLHFLLQINVFIYPTVVIPMIAGGKTAALAGHFLLVPASFFLLITDLN